MNSCMEKVSNKFVKQISETKKEERSTRYAL